jgi:hypothetical protein
MTLSVSAGVASIVSMGISDARGTGFHRIVDAIKGAQALFAER